VPDFLDKLYRFRDQMVFYWNNPSVLKEMFQAHHQTWIAAAACFVVLMALLVIVLKPSRKKEENGKVAATPAIEKNPFLSGYTLPVTVEKVHAKSRLKPSKKEEPHFLIKEDHTHAVTKKEPHLQELTLEEEQTLNEAMARAGKEALAEYIGEPHQIEFFHTDAAVEAAKKMFARQREAEEEVQAQATKARISRLDFVMLYFMAPRSQVFDGETLFQLFRELGLELNDDRVFEFVDEEGLQFYVASAIKPGYFDLHHIHYTTPGLSFVIDLKTVRNGKAALRKMLQCIHDVSEMLKGDILDDHRQRLTQNTINAYMAKIKSFISLQHDQ
jgi:FtsZ-interacting cell division protein ZipA